MGYKRSAAKNILREKIKNAGSDNNAYRECHEQHSGEVADRQNLIEVILAEYVKRENVDDDQ